LTHGPVGFERVGTTTVATTFGDTEPAGTEFVDEQP